MLLLKKIKFFILRQIDKAEIKLRKIFFSKEQKVFDKIYIKCKKKYNLKDDDGRNYSVFNLTSKIIKNNVPGSFVEAGVWKGAKIEVMIETLKSYKVLDRDIYLIDTFEGMTDPSDKDFHSITQRPTIKNKLKYTLDDVKKNILQLGYPEEKIHFIKIDVRDTELLKSKIKSEIALLRIDTNTYDTVLSCLNAFYFKVVKNGYVIHDDFNSWNGHKEAVLNFAKANNISLKFIHSSIWEEIQKIK